MRTNYLKAFTLVEMLMTLAISSIIIGATYSSYQMVANQYSKNIDVAQMHTSGRAIMRIIERDIRMAGFEYRDDNAIITYGAISNALTITDSGNQCCDDVSIVYDYFDEASQKVERLKVRYWTKAYSSNKGNRHRLYKQIDILGRNNVLLASPVVGVVSVMADFIEDFQIGNIDEINKLTTGYTKIDENGKDLISSASVWPCVRDNTSGLIWESKTNNSDLHNKLTRFDWYNSDASTNGGYSGFSASNSVHGLVNDTEQFVISTNTEALCSFSNWTLPTRAELLTVYDKSHNPRIDQTYFPLVRGSQGYWSSTQDTHPTFVKMLNFDSGYSGGVHKNSGIHAMLVSQGSNAGLSKLIVISLTLRGKNEYNKSRQFKKKNYYNGNFKIDKTDKYKRDTFSTTVLVRNLAL